MNKSPQPRGVFTLPNLTSQYSVQYSIADKKVYFRMFDILSHYKLKCAKRVNSVFDKYVAEYGIDAIGCSNWIFVVWSDIVKLFNAYEKVYNVKFNLSENIRPKMIRLITPLPSGITKEQINKGDEIMRHPHVRRIVIEDSNILIEKFKLQEVKDPVVLRHFMYQGKLYFNAKEILAQYINPVKFKTLDDSTSTIAVATPEYVVAIGDEMWIEWNGIVENRKRISALRSILKNRLSSNITPTITFDKFASSTNNKPIKTYEEPNDVVKQQSLSFKYIGEAIKTPSVVNQSQDNSAMNIDDKSNEWNKVNLVIIPEDAPVKRLKVNKIKDPVKLQGAVIKFGGGSVASEYPVVYFNRNNVKYFSYEDLIKVFIVGKDKSEQYDIYKLAYKYNRYVNDVYSVRSRLFVSFDLFMTILDDRHLFLFGSKNMRLSQLTYKIEDCDTIGDPTSIKGNWADLSVMERYILFHNVSSYKEFMQILNKTNMSRGCVKNWCDGFSINMPQDDRFNKSVNMDDVKRMAKENDTIDRIAKKLNVSAAILGRAVANELGWVYEDNRGLLFALVYDNVFKTWFESNFIRTNNTSNEVFISDMVELFRAQIPDVVQTYGMFKGIGYLSELSFSGVKFDTKANKVLGIKIAPSATASKTKQPKTKTVRVPVIPKHDKQIVYREVEVKPEVDSCNETIRVASKEPEPVKVPATEPMINKETIDATVELTKQVQDALGTTTKAPGAVTTTIPLPDGRVINLTININIGK